jgi:ethanolamine utilization protein EutM
MAQEALGMIETKGLCALLEGCRRRPQGRQRHHDRLGKDRQRLRDRLLPRRRRRRQGRRRRRRRRRQAQVGEVVSVQVIPRPHEDLAGLGKWLQYGLRTPNP